MMTKSRIVAAILVTAMSTPARADLGECGQPFSNGANPQVTDALFILKAGVALQLCDFCLCDLNDSGNINVLDALIDLKGAVGQSVTFDCPECEPVTTTTIGGCPPADGLDDLVFKEKYSCIQAFTGQAYQCVDQNVLDSIRFTHKGGGNYEVRDEPDSGFVYTGSLSCTTFTWTATKPGEYSEEGEWEFTEDLKSFSGESSYEADSGAYQGYCTITGAKSPTNPPDTPPYPPCN